MDLMMHEATSYSHAAPTELLDIIVIIATCNGVESMYRRPHGANMVTGRAGSVKV
jgi:hypothetical protein